MTRNGLICIVVATILAGCSAPPAPHSAVRAAPRGSPESSTTVHRPTTTSEVPSSSDRSVPPPFLDTGTDYRAITRSFVDFLAWLEADSLDLTQIGKIAAPGSVLEAALRHDVLDLRHYNRRYVEIVSGPAEIDVIDARSDAFTVRYHQHLVKEEVVGLQGQVFSQWVPPTPVTDYVLLAVRMPNGPWRFANVEKKCEPSYPC